MRLNGVLLVRHFCPASFLNKNVYKFLVRRSPALLQWIGWCQRIGTWPHGTVVLLPQSMVKERRIIGRIPHTSIAQLAHPCSVRTTYVHRTHGPCWPTRFVTTHYGNGHVTLRDRTSKLKTFFNESVIQRYRTAVAVSEWAEFNVPLDTL